jgi:hypothetical protein
MTLRLRWAVLWALLALWLAFPVPALAQDKSLVWERFDVDIEVQSDGTFDVAEHQTIRFTSGTFTAGYRDIPIRNFSYLDNWEVTDESGNVYRQASGGEERYTFVVNQSSGSYVIEWFFPPTADATETYTLRYTVHEGLRYYTEGDQVWWKAIYANRSFPVEDGQVRVIVPPSATIRQWSAYINNVDARGSATAALVSGGEAVVYTLDRTLRPGEELEVRVEFTPDVVGGTVQPWQAAADAAAEQRQSQAAFRQRWGSVVTLLACVLGLLFTFGGPAGVYLLWYRRGRDKPVNQVAEYLPEPPTSLAPGMAGTLLDESADMQDIVATLVDLARRKAISITQVREEGIFANKWDFIYRRERQDVPLLPYEQKLLDGIFGRNDEITLSELKNKFYTRISGIKRALYVALVEAGYFPKNPDTVRTTYGVLGALGLPVAIVVGVLGAIVAAPLTDLGFVPGLGVGVTAIALIAVAYFMPRKTDRGAEEAARWRAFRTYLREIDKYTDIAAQKEIWDRYLPYAIAFGVDKEYIAKFAGVDAPAPGWYIPAPELYGPYRRGYFGLPHGGGTISAPGGGMSDGPGGGSGGGLGGNLSDMSRGMGASLTAMSAGLGAMLTSASSTLSSQPSSSSSGGWSGGGGFSGGGSFGGGGGGGGGGGFR